MEQATNLFNKGLQMDTHPMVQSNDSLTDCLNGTLITMNGNEVILQNDMGNRRVNNAFLPPGYQPIGIKEYGGVIYIAAYNPITNQSLIGSFPSPLKRFNNAELNNNLDLDFKIKSTNEAESNIFEETFNINDETGKYKNGLLKLEFIKSDTKFVMLTEDSAIYPGDKFVIYSSLIDEYGKDLLTNYDNVSGNKIKTPKNKDYTLYVGVLNSQNEFMDITPTLLRWNKENEIINFNKEYNYEVSDKFKFNSGYFIPKNFSNDRLEETIQDANFIRARLAYPVNTYSSKLIGPLYLKAQFNHVENFDYDIRGWKLFEKVSENSDETIEYVYLTITGYFTYNCLDTQVGEIQEDCGELLIPTAVIVNTSSQNSSSGASPITPNNNTPIEGYSNYNGGLDSYIDVTIDDSTHDRLYNFTFESGTTYNMKSFEGKDYVVAALTTPPYVDIIITLNEENWSRPYVNENNELYIPSKSIITVLATNRDKFVDGVELNGTYKNLKLLDNYGELDRNTWKPLLSTPRQVSFTCDFGTVSSIKVKTSDIFVRQTKFKNLYEGYLIRNYNNATSDFDLTDISSLIVYDPVDNTALPFVDINLNTIQSGSATIKVEAYKNAYLDSGGIALAQGTKFYVDVPNNYQINYIEIYGDEGIICETALLGFGTYENGVWDARSTRLSNVGSVEFVFLTPDHLKTGHLRRVVVHHNGISNIPKNAAINRNYTNYEILEELQRKGSSVSVENSKKLTLISSFSGYNSVGFLPNLSYRTVEISSNGKVIAYGHFETYDLTLEDLDNINDGIERNVDSYWAMRLVYDAYNDDYISILNNTNSVTFNVKKDAFGDFNFYEYLLNRELPEYVVAEDCSSNNEFTYSVNLL